MLLPVTAVTASWLMFLWICSWTQCSCMPTLSRINDWHAKNPSRLGRKAKRYSEDTLWVWVDCRVKLSNDDLGWSKNPLTGQINEPHPSNIFLHNAPIFEMNWVHSKPWAKILGLWSTQCPSIMLNLLVKIVNITGDTPRVYIARHSFCIKRLQQFCETHSKVLQSCGWTHDPMC